MVVFETFRVLGWMCRLGKWRLLLWKSNPYPITTNDLWKHLALASAYLYSDSLWSNQWFSSETIITSAQHKHGFVRVSGENSCITLAIMALFWSELWQDAGGPSSCPGFSPRLRHRVRLPRCTGLAAGLLSFHWSSITRQLCSSGILIPPGSFAAWLQTLNGQIDKAYNAQPQLVPIFFGRVESSCLFRPRQKVGHHSSTQEIRIRKCGRSGECNQTEKFRKVEVGHPEELCNTSAAIRTVPCQHIEFRGFQKTSTRPFIDSSRSKSVFWQRVVRVPSTLL